MTLLTLFYDGTCPLCVKEMNAIHKKDKLKQIKTVDINGRDFVAYPHVDYDRANAILHGFDAQGRLLLGLDAAYQAWALLGRGWMYAPLRWPVIRPMADKAYLVFARNRYRISKWFTGKEKCNCG